MLPALKTEVKRLLKVFLAKFVKIEAVRSAGDDLIKVNFRDSTIQVQDSDLSIGHKTWQFLSQEYFINESIKKKFFNGVRSFFVAVASTIVKKF